MEAFLPVCIYCKSTIKDKQGYLMSCGHFLCLGCCRGSQPSVCSYCGVRARAAMLEHPPAEVRNYLQNPLTQLKAANDVVMFQLDHFRSAANQANKALHELRLIYSQEVERREAAEEETHSWRQRAEAAEEAAAGGARGAQQGRRGSAFRGVAGSPWGTAFGARGSRDRSEADHHGDQVGADDDSSGGGSGSFRGREREGEGEGTRTAAGAAGAGAAAAAAAAAAGAGPAAPVHSSHYFQHRNGGGSGGGGGGDGRKRFPQENHAMSPPLNGSRSSSSAAAAPSARGRSSSSSRSLPHGQQQQQQQQQGRSPSVAAEGTRRLSPDSFSGGAPPVRPLRVSGSDGRGRRPDTPQIEASVHGSVSPHAEPSGRLREFPGEQQQRQQNRHQGRRQHLGEKGTPAAATRRPETPGRPIRPEWQNSDGGTAGLSRPASTGLGQVAGRAASPSPRSPLLAVRPGALKRPSSGNMLPTPKRPSGAGGGAGAGGAQPRRAGTPVPTLRASSPSPQIRSAQLPFTPRSAARPGSGQRVRSNGAGSGAGRFGDGPGNGRRPSSSIPRSLEAAGLFGMRPGANGGGVR